MGSYAAKLFKGTRSLGSCVAYFILFFSSVLIVTDVSLADEVDKAYSAIKNKNYKVAVVELEKALTSNKVGFARKNWARETLGSFLLEGREGVPADTFRSYKLLTRAALDWDYPSKKAAAYLGSAFWHGKGLPKNPAASRKWYSFAVNLGDQASEKWLQREDILDKEKRFLKAKAKWRSGKPKADRPFGIVFGYDFPFELSYEYYDTLSDFALKYDRVEVPAPLPEGDIYYNGYEVYVTPKTGKVFQVQTDLTFESVEMCRNSLWTYVLGLSSDAEEKNISSCENCQIDERDWIYGERLWGDINGPPSSKVNSINPLFVKSDTPMVGTRLFAECYSDSTDGEAIGKLAFRHLPSYEIYIAETLKHSRAQNWYGKIKGETVSHASFVPFGIRLLAPIQGGFSSIVSQKSRQSILPNYYSDAHTYDVDPVNAAKIFTDYFVAVSPFSETVVLVDASATFTTHDNCAVTMEAAAQDIFEKHATGKFNNTLKIFTDAKKGSGIEPRQRWVEPFYVTSSGFSKKYDKSQDHDLSSVRINLNCLRGGRDTVSFKEKFGAKANKMWELSVSYYPVNGLEFINSDLCLLNPNSDCNKQ